MTLKQRICGFLGHKSKLWRFYQEDILLSVGLKCEKCGFKTKEFEI